jgi:hypothetical protein
MGLRSFAVYATGWNGSDREGCSRHYSTSEHLTAPGSGRRTAFVRRLNLGEIHRPIRIIRRSHRKNISMRGIDIQG